MKSLSCCRGKFVSQKVSRVRWLPSRGDAATHAQREHWAQEGTHFVTGAWDEEHPLLTLWQLPSEAAGATDITKKAALKHDGDVNDIKFVSSDCFASASSTGCVSLVSLRETPDGWTMENIKKWENTNQGSCTSLDLLDRLVFCVFSSGVVSVLNAAASGAKSVVRTLEGADSCDLTAVAAVTQEEVLAANMRGQIKMFDLREGSQQVTSSSVVPHGESASVSCLSKHPSQPHIVGSGAADGTVAFWDLRQLREAVTRLKGHDKGVTELVFHRNQPDHMFTSSENGEVWHWNGSAASRLNFNNAASATSSSNNNLWFNNEAVKHRVETSSLLPEQPLPINSIDSMGTSLVAAGDNEVVYAISGLVV